MAYVIVFDVKSQYEKGTKTSNTLFNDSNLLNPDTPILLHDFKHENNSNWWLIKM